MKGPIILIQPPFVQLNSPYPSLYYLRSFLEKHGYAVIVRDHSISLFQRIFSSSGLERIFADVKKAQAVQKTPKNSASFYYIQRFLSEEKLWLDCIDPLIDLLRGQNREWAHFLCLANGSFPSGPRTDAFISESIGFAEQGGNVAVDSASLLATKMLSDLADFITQTVDPGFSLISYMSSGLSPGLSASDFDQIENGRNGYIMENFYRPFLNEEWAKLQTEKPQLLGLTIPFPGCFFPALICAESAKKHFGKSVTIIAGGGYVNTEIREWGTGNGEWRAWKACEYPLGRYFDCISLDRPFAFLLSLLGGCKYNAEQAKTINDEAAKTVFPDYTGVDFSQYLFPVDDENPMHRLWSDGHWLKAYLAHGCYWHSCSFCDTSLDYIKEFIPVDPKALFRHLLDQAKKTGCRGIHLVDEAAPPALLLKLCLLNREAGLPLIFWGNIRLEKNFNPDTAAVLAAGGLVGVSTGLEVPTPSGLDRMCKGVTLNEMVHACAAFKEAGILVHGYLIYGYWDEDEQEIINAAEIVRQIFEQGLLDSAFWHKFTLGCYSKLHAEKLQGLHQKLQVIDPVEEPFALNNLSFKGEDKFGKYSKPLEILLAAWMNGNTDKMVTDPFPFKVKVPTVAPDYISMIVDEYARCRNKSQRAIPAKNGQLIFLGSKLLIQSGNKTLLWRWRLSDRKIKTNDPDETKKLVSLLENASSKGMEALSFFDDLEKIFGEEQAIKVWKILRAKGIVLY